MMSLQHNLMYEWPRGVIVTDKYINKHKMNTIYVTGAL